MVETANVVPPVHSSRRSSHVCSIKGCHNLLSPQIPWKMCDLCREHDRDNRRNKKLRDLGELPPLRFQITMMGEKKDTSKSIEIYQQEPTHVHETLASSSSSASKLSVQSVESIVSQTSPPDVADEASMELLYPEAPVHEVRLSRIVCASTSH